MKRERENPIVDSDNVWSETTVGKCCSGTDSGNLACMNIPIHGWQSWMQYPAEGEYTQLFQ